ILSRFTDSFRDADDSIPERAISVPGVFRMVTRTYMMSAAPVFVITALFLSQQPSPPSQPPAGAPTPGQQVPGGRGGGRGNPGAPLFTATCSGCHGTPDLTGRAPWLFDQKWLDGTDDGKIAATIRRGVPDKGMVGFSPEQISDEQIFQLIAYIRTAT